MRKLSAAVLLALIAWTPAFAAEERSGEHVLDRVRGYVDEWREFEGSHYQETEANLRQNLISGTREQTRELWLDYAQKAPLHEHTARMSGWLIQTLAEKQVREGHAPNFAERVGALFDGSAADTALRVQQFAGEPSTDAPPQVELTPEQHDESRQIVLDWIEHGDRLARFALRSGRPETFERSVERATRVMSEHLDREQEARADDPAPAFARRVIERVAQLRLATSYVTPNLEEAHRLLEPLTQKIDAALREVRPLADVETALKEIGREHMKQLFALMGMEMKTKGDVELMILGRKVPVAMNDAGQIEEFLDLDEAWKTLAADLARGHAENEASEMLEPQHVYVAAGLEDAAKIVSEQATLPPPQIRMFNALARLEVAALRLLEGVDARLEKALAEIESATELSINEQEKFRRADAIVERYIRDWSAAAKRRTFRIVPVH